MHDVVSDVHGAAARVDGDRDVLDVEGRRVLQHRLHVLDAAQGRITSGPSAARKCG